MQFKNPHLSRTPMRAIAYACATALGTSCDLDVDPSDRDAPDDASPADASVSGSSGSSGPSGPAALLAAPDAEPLAQVPDAYPNADVKEENTYDQTIVRIGVTCDQVQNELKQACADALEARIDQRWKEIKAMYPDPSATNTGSNGVEWHQGNGTWGLGFKCVQVGVKATARCRKSVLFSTFVKCTPSWRVFPYILGYRCGYVSADSDGCVEHFFDFPDHDLTDAERQASCEWLAGLKPTPPPETTTSSTGDGDEGSGTTVDWTTNGDSTTSGGTTTSGGGTTFNDTSTSTGDDTSTFGQTSFADLGG